MTNADTLALEIQELLDAGNSKNKVALLLSLDHKQIDRVVDKFGLEIYVPFDECEPTAANDVDELFMEDILEKACDEAFDDFRVNLNEFFGKNYNDAGGYVSYKYGTLINYLKTKDKILLEEFIFAQCAKCGSEKTINKFLKRERLLFGLTKECHECRAKRLNFYYHTNEDYRDGQKNRQKKWAENNKDKIRVYMKRANHIRAARKKGLVSDFSITDLERTMRVFENVCVLTGSDETHLDHVIPLSVGHGGTTYGNMIPLRSDLNLSKNNSNIFEWFEANRQRFELSQERFDNLIAWLASANAMTVEDYRKHVYWCHANPRSIDELKDAKEVI